MHRALCTIFRLARLALHLRIHDSSALARRRAAWSLLLAYVATGSSVIGGFYHFANLLLHDATGHVISAVLLVLVVPRISSGSPGAT